MHKLPPKKYIRGNSLDLIVGQQLSIQAMRTQLVDAGYQAVDSVFEHGEFAVRGSILDIYPMGSRFPYRIDLLDDEIETLRTFNPETQRSDQRIEQIRLLPGREYPLDANGITAFRSNFREKFDVGFASVPALSRRKRWHQPLPGSSITSPCSTSTWTHYSISCLLILPAAGLAISPALDKISGRISSGVMRSGRLITIVRSYRPTKIFLTIDTVLADLKQFKQISFASGSTAVSLQNLRLPELSSDAKLKAPFAAVEQFIEQNPEQRILFCAESAGRRETLLEVLKQIQIKPEQFEHLQDFVDSTSSRGIIVAPLDQGLWLEDKKLLLITEAQLFGNRIAQRRRRNKKQSDTDFIIKSLTELSIDDAVVHLDHRRGSLSRPTDY